MRWNVKLSDHACVRNFSDPVACRFREPEVVIGGFHNRGGSDTLPPPMPLCVAYSVMTPAGVILPITWMPLRQSLE